VGGVVLARRRGGLEEGGELSGTSPLNVRRPLGTGTTAEAVGSGNWGRPR